MTLNTTRADFVAGLSAASRGLTTSLKNRDVRQAYIRMVAALMVVSSWLLVSGIWAVIHFTPIADDASLWMTVLMWAMRVAGIVLVALTSPLIALTGINLLVPLLAERLFFSSMTTVAPARAAELAASAGLSFTASTVDALRRLLRFFAQSIAVFVLSFIPVVGSFGGPVAQAYLTSRAMSWELLDPYFDKLQWRYADQRRLVAQRRGAMVGFGLPIAVVMMVPIVGPLVFGLAQAAAAVFVAEVIEATPIASATSTAEPPVP